MTDRPGDATPETAVGARVGGGGPNAEPGELPEDVAAWIDAHDVDVAVASVDDVLIEQRAAHADEDPGAAIDDSVQADAAPVAELVNNVGDDGGAASG